MRMKWYSQWMARLGLADKPRVRKLIVAVIGSTIVLFGFVLLVLPGPAVLVIPLGLAILATEFAWARRLVRRGEAVWGKARQWRRRKTASPRAIQKPLSHG
jgi:tellurite resistance protein TerC